MAGISSKAGITDKYNNNNIKFPLFHQGKKTLQYSFSDHANIHRILFYNSTISDNQHNINYQITVLILHDSLGITYDRYVLKLFLFLHLLPLNHLKKNNPDDIVIPQFIGAKFIPSGGVVGVGFVATTGVLTFPDRRVH